LVVYDALARHQSQPDEPGPLYRAALPFLMKPLRSPQGDVHVATAGRSSAYSRRHGRRRTHSLSYLPGGSRCRRTAQQPGDPPALDGRPNGHYPARGLIRMIPKRRDSSGPSPCGMRHNLEASQALARPPNGGYRYAHGNQIADEEAFRRCLHSGIPFGVKF
jgi:hypothetical protein